jgi:hypothetical protein
LSGSKWRFGNPIHAPLEMEEALLNREKQPARWVETDEVRDFGPSNRPEEGEDRRSVEKVAELPVAPPEARIERHSHTHRHTRWN